MEKNPVFEFSQDGFSAEANSAVSGRILQGRNAVIALPKQPVSKKLSGRLLIAFIAVVGLLILGGIVAIVVFKPSFSSSSSDQASSSLSAEMESFKMQFQKLLDEKANRTHYQQLNETIGRVQSQLSQLSTNNRSVHGTIDHMQQQQNKIQMQQESVNITIHTELNEV